MKKLVIISGITGAIGSALLAEYAQQTDTIVYGISRKALPVEHFTLPDGTLPHATLICSIPNFDSEGWNTLIERINFNDIEHVIYIHGLGYFPFEINKQGNHGTKNDHDSDGIDDEVLKLTYMAFRNAAENLIKSPVPKLNCILFGSLSDVHRPTAHTSWWKTMERTKSFMRQTADERTSMIVCTISSVLCPHELITRPYVFIQTDAVARFWLTPHEFARFVVNKNASINGGFHEIEKFNINPNFDLNHYSDEKFTPRKIAELYRKS